MQAMRWALRKADVVTAGSIGLLEKVRSVAHLDQDRTTFAPLGVDVAMFTPEGGRRETTPTIINVGSLQPVKGQGDLIRAFRFVIDREPNARLAIVGDGPLRAELETLVVQLQLADRVSFAGDVRHERLPDLYHAVGLFVQASFHESQGMAMLEAAACGVPIVGTPVGALADLAPDAAVASPPGDPIRLARAILSVLGDTTRCRMLGDAARTRVAEVYSLDAAMSRFGALYRK
jgi:glycosyltransferase involved in cell wall biosynthesis